MCYVSSSRSWCSPSCRRSARNSPREPRGAALPAFPLGGALAGPNVAALLTATTAGGLAVPATNVLSGTVPGGLRPFSLADTGSTNSYAGSISSDDSRMNFDKGDLTSGVIKMTNDIQASYENYTVFARVNSFYDAVLGSAGSYERSALRSDGYPDTVRDIDLLELLAVSRAARRARKLRHERSGAALA